MEIKNIKKMEKGDNYYRIRIGDFRLGLKIDQKEAIFIRLLNRKDIYKFFP